MSMLSGRGSLRRGCCGIRKVRRLGWLWGKESAGWNGDGWIKEEASICGVEGYGVVVVRGTQCRGAISERDGRLALDLDDAHSRIRGDRIQHMSKPSELKDLRKQIISTANLISNRSSRDVPRGTNAGLASSRER